MSKDKDSDVVTIRQIDLSQLNKLAGGDGFEEINILRKDKPDVVFEGRTVARVDSRDFAGAHAGGGKHWTELELYELRSGDWVACSIACSDKQGQVDFGEIEFLGAKTITNITPEMFEPSPYADDPRANDDPRFFAKRAAMEFWGWSWLAKELADKAGWDVRERIG